MIMITQFSINNLGFLEVRKNATCYLKPSFVLTVRAIYITLETILPWGPAHCPVWSKVVQTNEYLRVKHKCSLYSLFEPNI